MTPHTHALPDGRRAYCADRTCPAGDRIAHQHREFVGYESRAGGTWADVPCVDERCTDEERRR